MADDDRMTDEARSDGIFAGLAARPGDPLLALIGAYRGDPRPDKIDVGVGVYRDTQGRTPVFGAIKAAERRLIEAQDTKAYLGPEGDIRFCELIGDLAFERVRFGDRMSALQTPGGTGALRLAAELIAAGRSGARVFVGTPTWANHLPILKAAGLDAQTFPYFDVATQTVLFDQMVTALEGAGPGDAVLLHGCCHNPLGADLTPDQWQALTEVVARRGVLPIIDLAYHGLGDGLEADVAGLRTMLGGVERALVAYSCDKNFGLYRERTGALFAVAANGVEAGIVQSNLLSLARAAWSMPPDHGAAAVRIVLDDRELTADWRQELDGMRQRIGDVRRQLASLDPVFAAVTTQKGMFSTLPLTPPQVAALRRDHGVYMAASGRISVAGLTAETVPVLARAVAAVRGA